MTETVPTRDGQGRWQPGASGNPDGRPRKGACLAEALRRRLSAAVTMSNGARATVAEAVAGRLVALALGGDVSALRLLFERSEGRAPLALDLLDLDDTRVVLMPLPPPPDPGEAAPPAEAAPVEDPADEP